MAVEISHEHIISEVRALRDVEVQGIKVQLRWMVGIWLGTLSLVLPFVVTGVKTLSSVETGLANVEENVVDMAHKQVAFENWMLETAAAREDSANERAKIMSTLAETQLELTKEMNENYGELKESIYRHGREGH